MRFLRRIAGLLGLGRDEDRDHREQEEDEQDDHHSPNHPRSPSNFQETGPRRKGFSVQVAVDRPQVAVDRPQVGPIILPCSSGDGGVQGLKWHAKRLRMDEDGDVADEFLDEVLPGTSSSSDAQSKPFPRFELKCSTRPAKVKKQVLSNDGKIQQCVEYQGRLQWV